MAVQPGDAPQQLRWFAGDAVVRVENPTPYFITVIALEPSGERYGEGLRQPGHAGLGKGDEHALDAAVQRIRYASNETNYCPRCQTGGKLLADRSLSRLLRDDWPRRIEEIE